MKPKVKLCRAVGSNDLDAGHFCVCSSADWHLEAGLSYHGCDCGRSWKEEATS